MKRILKALNYSLAGIISCYKTETSFKQEVWIFILAVPLAFFIGNSKTEVTLLIGSGMLVLIVELLNSSIENAANRFGTEYHEFIKFAKDQGSAAVLVSIVLTLFVWIYIGFL